MIANALSDKHHGMTLVRDKRRYVIDAVEHTNSFVLVHARSGRGRQRLPLPLHEEIQVEP